jgi:hypothetical protein
LVGFAALTKSVQALTNKAFSSTTIKGRRFCKAVIAPHLAGLEFWTERYDSTALPILAWCVLQLALESRQKEGIPDFGVDTYCGKFLVQRFWQFLI